MKYIVWINGVLGYLDIQQKKIKPSINYVNININLHLYNTTTNFIHETLKVKSLF